MVNMYRAFVQPKVRKVICESGITLDRAIHFLKETEHGIIEDFDGRQYTIEELKNVKNIRSLPGIGASSFPAGGEEVHEDSDRELFESVRDNAEPSSECDN